jgi:hypothetical protein
MGKRRHRKSTRNIKRVMSLMNVLIFVCSLGSIDRPLMLGQMLLGLKERCECKLRTAILLFIVSHMI